MAIVPMNKIFIAGMNSDRAAVMENLLGAGVVQMRTFLRRNSSPIRIWREGRRSWENSIP